MGRKPRVEGGSSRNLGDEGRDREPHPAEQRQEHIAPSHAGRMRRSDGQRTGDVAPLLGAGRNDLPHLAKLAGGVYRGVEDRTPRAGAPGPGFCRRLRSFRGRPGAAKGQHPLSCAAFAASRALRRARKPVSPLRFARMPANPLPAFARGVGLGATPLPDREGEPGKGRLLPPLLPRSGSLPARACGAMCPCGKANSPPSAGGGGAARPAGITGRPVSRPRHETGRTRGRPLPSAGSLSGPRSG